MTKVSRYKIVELGRLEVLQEVLDEEWAIGWDLRTTLKWAESYLLVFVWHGRSER